MKFDRNVEGDGFVSYKSFAHKAPSTRPRYAYLVLLGIH